VHYLHIFNVNIYKMHTPQEAAAKLMLQHIYQISSGGYFLGTNKYNW